MTTQPMREDDAYAAYAARFDPLRSDRQARRRRKTSVRPAPRRTESVVVEDIAETVGLEAGFQPTYQPSKYEGGWLLDALEDFYDQQIITDVLSMIRGGKEASVYVCAAHESTGQALLAAKVYRPRMFRHLRNDKLYREGRQVFMDDGTVVNDSDFREMRAITKGTVFGQKVMHTSWLMHEYKTLEALYTAGAAVPRPWAVSDNVILMEYIGDETTAAPMLNTVTLEPDEAERVFQELLHSIRLLLQGGWIHGDLSAYNVLYWHGRAVLIDFPQVTDIAGNPHARAILQRDIVRICEYFARQSARHDPQVLVEELWCLYGVDAM